MIGQLRMVYFIQNGKNTIHLNLKQVFHLLTRNIIIMRMETSNKIEFN